MASEYFRQALEEGWAKAKAAKAERRARNREEWRTSPKNAMNVRQDAIEAIASEIPGDSTGDGSDSLAELRRLMADKDVALHRRIDCAEVILAYELGPGAAVGAKTDEIAAGSFRFLKSVTDTPESPEALRFRCLKLIAAVENARAASKNTVAEHAAKRRLLIALVNSVRTRSFRTAGTWREAVKTDAWALTNADAFDWPKGWPGDWVWPLATFSALLEQDHDVTAFRELLLSIRATNRDDRWEDYLGPTY